MTYATNARGRRLSDAVTPRNIAIAAAVSIFILFAVTIIVRMAAINTGARRIDALNAQIAAERSRCQQLSVALSERRSDEMIRDEAKNRLGMYNPEETAAVRVVSLPFVADETVTVYDAPELAQAE